MTSGSSQGLFVIVAVVIFGIFIIISYLLFRDKLQTGLASIFDDSTSNINIGYYVSENLISKTTFGSYQKGGVSKVSDNEFNFKKDVVNTDNNGNETYDRTHIMYTYQDSDIKSGDKYIFSIEAKLNSVSSTTLTSNTINLRYANLNSSGSEVHSITESPIELNNLTIGEWQKITVEMTIPENVDLTTLKNSIRASISVNGYIKMDLNYRNPQLIKMSKSIIK